MKFTADGLEKAILAATDEPSRKIIRRVSVAGQQILYSEKTHKQIFDDILAGEGNPAEKLGRGIANIMLVLYDKSRKQQPQGAPAQPTPQGQPTPANVPAPAAPVGLINAQAPTQPAAPAQPPAAPAKSPATMPRGALLPAGGILLAKASEFAQQAGMAQMDDAMLNEAFATMAVRINDRFDKNFRAKVGEKTGKSMQPQQAQPTPQAPPQPGGLINAQRGAM